MTHTASPKEPLRVLHVIGAMDRGGAETLIMNLYRAIDRDRIQFDFLVNSTEPCDYDAEIESLGGHIHRIQRYALYNNLSYVKECRRFFEAHPYKIVHGHIGFPAAFYLSTAKNNGAFTIAHSHAQNYPLSPEELVYRAVASQVRGKADFYLACSEKAGFDRFGNKIVNGNRFYVLKNGIDVERCRFSDTSRMAIREELGIGADELLFGHVGRLSEVKNHAYLFKVFKEILASCPTAKLALAGRGELEDKLRAEANSLGIDQNTLFLGIREDVPDLMSGMDTLIFPSFREGLGCTLIEAQASGLPCIVSNGVSPEAKYRDNLQFMSLDLSPREWARAALLAAQEASLDCRKRAYQDAQAAGFDINDSAKWLAKLYAENA